MQRSLIRLIALSSPLAIAALLAAVGCGPEEPFARRVASRAGSESAADKSIGLAPQNPATSSADNAPAESTSSTVPASEQISRKLIYTADAELVVEEFDPVPASIEALVRKHRGFIASSQISGARGEPRSGTWQVRIPTDQFEAFLSATAAIGEVRSISRKSQDVTEEFFDVEARIRNKRVQEAGLLKILEDRPGKLEDVLAVERELSRVREEMERMEGRLRLLADLTSLTTVNIRVAEIKNYVPPQTPTFTRRVARSFQGSLTALRHSAEAAVVTLAAALPWLVTLTILALPVIGLTRWLLRRRGHLRD